MSIFYKPSKPIVLAVMDGVGIAPPGPGNAVTLANTANLDKLWPKYPHGSLLAAGMAVGLPEGVDGNSEVGHMTLGAGKVVFQDLPRIDQRIKNGNFFNNPELLGAINFAKKNGGNVHLIGLVGHGQVHSSLNHLYKLIKLAASQEVAPERFFIHAFLDGRDSSPTAGLQILQEIEKELLRYRIGRIASFIGRYYAMDRDKRWERTRAAYELITQGKGEKTNNYKKVIKKNYQNGLTDEYMTPYVIPGFEGKVATIRPADAIINFNFRPDRAQQLTIAIEEREFQGFERPFIENIHYVGFSDYKKGYPKRVAFPQEKIVDSLGKVLGENRLTQLRVAESEKFPHVTYFFDGGKQIVYPGEEQIEIPSPKSVATYDLSPEMSSRKIVEVFLRKQEEVDYDFSVINFAPPDMVAHTGVLDAAIKAMEVVDWGIGEIANHVLSKNGTLLITSDHGNCEELINLRTGEVDTKHSSNPVPFLAVNNKYQAKELQVGTLSDVAPTILGLLGIPKPAEMTGRNLLG